MVYPYWTNDDLLREKMIDNRIFVAPYWPNVGNWCALKNVGVWFDDQNVSFTYISAMFYKRHEEGNRNFVELIS